MGQLPCQPLLLLVAFMLLLCLLTWNLLHLCMAGLLPVLDNLGPHGLVGAVAGQHGLAAACFPQVVSAPAVAGA